MKTLIDSFARRDWVLVSKDVLNEKGLTAAVSGDDCGSDCDGDCGGGDCDCAADCGDD